MAAFHCLYCKACIRKYDKSKSSASIVQISFHLDTSDITKSLEIFQEFNFKYFRLICLSQVSNYNDISIALLLHMLKFTARSMPTLPLLKPNTNPLFLLSCNLGLNSFWMCKNTICTCAADAVAACNGDCSALVPIQMEKITVWPKARKTKAAKRGFFPCVARKDVGKGTAFTVSAQSLLEPNTNAFSRHAWQECQCVLAAGFSLLSLEQLQTMDQANLPFLLLLVLLMHVYNELYNIRLHWICTIASTQHVMFPDQYRTRSFLASGSPRCQIFHNISWHKAPRYGILLPGRQSSNLLEVRSWMDRMDMGSDLHLLRSINIPLAHRFPMFSAC